MNKIKTIVFYYCIEKFKIALLSSLKMFNQLKEKVMVFFHFKKKKKKKKVSYLFILLSTNNAKMDQRQSNIASVFKGLILSNYHNLEAIFSLLFSEKKCYKSM